MTPCFVFNKPNLALLFFDFLRILNSSTEFLFLYLYKYKNEGEEENKKFSSPLILSFSPFFVHKQSAPEFSLH